jgi:hypothetical protein
LKKGSCCFMLCISSTPFSTQLRIYFFEPQSFSVFCQRGQCIQNVTAGIFNLPWWQIKQTMPKKVRPKYWILLHLLLTRDNFSLVPDEWYHEWELLGIGWNLWERWCWYIPFWRCCSNLWERVETF